MHAIGYKRAFGSGKTTTTFLYILSLIYEMLFFIKKLCL